VRGDPVNEDEMAEHTERVRWKMHTNVL